MRYCKGSVSYISEEVVRTNLLPERNQGTILDWFFLGKGAESAKTRCDIVHPDQIPNCDVALAEDYGKQDTEEFEEGEDNEGLSENLRPYNSGACVLSREVNADEPPVRFHETSAPPSFSPEEESALYMVGRVTYETALSALKRKAPQPTPAHCSSTSFPVDSVGTQCKRSRIH